MTLERVREAAAGLGRHPQDHGWRELYRLLTLALERVESRLAAVVATCRIERSDCSDTHFVTLLGIALKATLSADDFEILLDPGRVTDRLRILERLATERGDEIRRVVLSRQNSFTGARRFLVPQTLLSAYFARQDGTRVNFADLGTGLGIMPRQLNSQWMYDRFSVDLTWPSGVPEFRPIPLRSRFGVDRGDRPSLDWVHACYGRSPYYASLYEELLSVVRFLESTPQEVAYVSLDMLDPAALADFVRRNDINAVNLCYTLYEIDAALRERVLGTLLTAMSRPCVVIVTEPYGALTQRGCTVSVYDHENPTPLAVCAVSDGHFVGNVDRLDDYDRFVADYPIAFN